MQASSFAEIKRAVTASSRDGSKIFSQALSDVNRSISTKFGTQFTRGTRKVFDATQEAWCAGAHEFSVRVQSELSRVVDDCLELRNSMLDTRLRAVESDLSAALDASTKTLGELESNILHDAACHFVSVYKAAIEFAFLDLIAVLLRTCKQSLVRIIKASLHDHPTVKSSSLCARFYRDKRLAQSIEEALCFSYRLLDETIEEGAQRTLGLFHKCFLSGQTRLFESLQVGLMKGLEEASDLVTCCLNTDLLQPLNHLHLSSLETFSSNLERQIGTILSTRAQGLAVSQGAIFEQAAQQWTTDQRKRLLADLERLFQGQKNSLQSAVLNWLVSLLEMN